MKQKQKACNFRSICKKTLNYGFMLMLILLLSLSGCGGETEYTIADYTQDSEHQHHNEVTEITPSVNAETGGLEVSDIADSAIGTLIPDTITAIVNEDVDENEQENQENEQTQEENIPEAEAVPVVDVSSLVLQNVEYRNGLIHITDEEGRLGLLNSSGTLIVAPRWDISFGEHSDGLVRATIDLNRRGGFIDTTTGEWAIMPSFWLNPRSAPVFRYGVAVVSLDDGRVGVIDRDGEWVIPPEQRVMYTRFFYGGLNIITQGGQSFIINTAGETIFPLPHMDIYDTIGTFSLEAYNLISTFIDGYTSFFDFEGNLIGTIEYDFPYHVLDIYLLDGMVIAHSSAVHCQVAVDTTIEFRVFDIQGNKITNRYYTSIGRFWEGFAPVEVGRPTGHCPTCFRYMDRYNWDNVFWGLIDNQGNEVIPPIHWHVSNVTHGLVQVFSDYGFAVLNTANEYIVPFGEFNNFVICDQGLIIAGRAIGGTSPVNQLKGLLDNEGNEIIPPRYNIIRSYRASNHRAGWGWQQILIQAGIYAPDRWGWYLSNIHGGVHNQTFVEGRAAVAYGGLWGYIDITGNEVIPLQFVYAGTFIDGMALVNVGGTRARPHTWRSERSWEDIYNDSSHYSAYGGTWHLIDLYGNILKTFEHEFVKRVNTNVFVFSNDVTVSNLSAFSQSDHWPSHVGGRYSLLWDEHGFVGINVQRCTYITLIQMNFENLSIIVIESPPPTEVLHEAIFTNVHYADGFVYVREHRDEPEIRQSNFYGGLLDYRGNELIPMAQNLSFSNIDRNRWLQAQSHELSDGIVVASTEEGVGFIDTNTGEWVIFYPVESDIDHFNISPRMWIFTVANIYPFAYGVAVVCNGRGVMNGSVMGVINSDGEWVFEMTRGYISNQFINGLAIVNEWVVDEEGEFLYWDIYVINTEGEIVFPLTLVEDRATVIAGGRGDITMLSDNIFSVVISDFQVDDYGSVYDQISHHVLLDLDGNLIFHPQYYFNFEHADISERGHRWGNDTAQAGAFSEGYAPLRVGYFQWHGVNMYTVFHSGDMVLMGLVDENGNVVIQPQYLNIGQVTNGRIVAESAERNEDGNFELALLNTAGEYIIPMGHYNEIWLCSNEPIAVVSIILESGREVSGMMDLDGNYIIPPRYDEIRQYFPAFDWFNVWAMFSLHDNPIFSEGRAAVRHHLLWGFVDVYGYEVIPPQFNYVGAFMNGVALVNFQGNWKLIDLYGNVLESFEYRDMSRLNANLLTFKEGENTGIIRII